MPGRLSPGGQDQGTLPRSPMAGAEHGPGRRGAANAPSGWATRSVRLSPLGRSTGGIWVVPAGGLPGGRHARRCAGQRRTRSRRVPCCGAMRGVERRVEQFSHTNRRRIHTSAVLRPDTSKSRTRRRRGSCARVQRNPHNGRRGRLSVDSTSNPNSLGVSTATASTRISRRCIRTPLDSQATGTHWIIDHDNHRFQQGVDPQSGTLNHPAPHASAQPHSFASPQIKADVI